MLYFARNGYIYWFYDRPELAIGLFLIYAALRHSFFREVPERQWRWLNGGKTRGVCFKRGSLIGFFNPVIPRVIFGIPLPCTFNPECRPAFALKSRIPSFKQGKSRLPRNLKTWGPSIRGVLVVEVSLKRQLTVIKAQVPQATKTKSVRNGQNCMSIFSVENRYFPSA